LLSQAQAETLLLSDLQTGGYISSVEKEFAGVTLKQNQFDALVCLAYNLGPNIWSKINLTNDIKNGASASVLKTDFESLCHVNGVASSGLLRRRDAEWEMYTQGVYELN
jgi:lysozyme